MKRTAVILITLLLSAVHLNSATLLALYEGGMDPTTAGQSSVNQWTKSAGVNSVYANSYTHNQDFVWAITDPGTPATSSPAVLANLYYQKVFNVTTTSGLKQGAWSLSTQFKIAENGDASPLQVQSDTWVGYITQSDTNPADRWMWAFLGGRNAQGETIITLYGTSTTFSLGTAFSEVTLDYDAVTKVGRVYINGQYMTDYAGAAVTGGGSGGTSMVYWGDNRSQNATTPERTTYYKFVSFSQVVPEPSKMALILLGVVGFGFRRSR